MTTTADLLGNSTTDQPRKTPAADRRCSDRRVRVRGEDGSVSVELVLLTPLLLVLVAFIVLAGRLTDLRLQVESAAHQAARAASQQPEPSRAAIASARIAAELEPRCGTPTAVTDTSRWAPGGTVAVTVTCQAELADLTLLPIPATVPVSASFISPIDRFATQERYQQ